MVYQKIKSQAELDARYNWLKTKSPIEQKVIERGFIRSGLLPKPGVIVEFPESVAPAEVKNFLKTCPGAGGGALHKEICDILYRNGWSKKDFYHSLYKLFCDYEDIIPCHQMDPEERMATIEQAKGLVSRFKAGGWIKPDAYRIKIEDWGVSSPVAVLECTEVVISHPISERNITIYSDLWQEIETCCRAHFRLFRINEDRTCSIVMDLFALMYGPYDYVEGTHGEYEDKIKKDGIHEDEKGKYYYRKINKVDQLPQAVKKMYNLKESSGLNTLQEIAALLQ